MLRGMVFVDHMNFDIAVQDLYIKKGEKSPKLDYNTLFRGVVTENHDVDYIKTFIFAPAPDDFLMKDDRLLKYYKWIQGFKNAKYTDVIEGRYIARPVNPAVAMDINNRDTYYKVEKGTDINLAIHALSKDHFNSYDIAFVMSVDTDYISVYRQLKNIGKIVILVAIEGQHFNKIVPEVDDFIVLKKDFFDKHTRS